ncbi:hypothetical protein [uncultured Acetobacterium sp.]|uniref:hypothetical protein n=1 Tax=uncultured Acetobacterium sp. TaxID=217139 RepID=UPI0025FC9074|nr:hypothetical protein [uncultured Acetobacterium sp.]MDP2843757.1 hypothetical protein [Acetobacterium sp.]
MSTEIKTLDGWCEFSDRTGKESIHDYLNFGDIVSEDVVDNFMDMLPPRAMSYGYLQVGEAYDHIYDTDGRLRAIYLTFAKYNGQWRYYGNCFAWDTVDKTGSSGII